MQAVVPQQNRVGFRRFAVKTDQLAGILQAGFTTTFQRYYQVLITNGVVHRIPVRASRQRCRAVKHATGVGNHFGAAFRVKAGAFLRAILFGNRIGAVQGVVKAAPAGVRRVQRIACVAHRHNQLRACLNGNFTVNVGGGRFYISRRFCQVANLFQEATVSRHIGDRAGVFPVPCI